MHDAPPVSVLVPTYQSATVLPGCLQAIRAQDYAGRIEVLVADGGSTDGTQAVAAAAAAAGQPVRVLHNPARTQAAGLNLAAEAAGGEVLVRCDAQARLPAHALTRFVAEHRRAGRLNVGGRQVAIPTGTPFGDAVAAVYNTRLGSGSAAYRVASQPAEVVGPSHAAEVVGPSHAAQVETVYLGSWRRADWLAFDPAFLANQDTEHNIRWRRAGGRVLLLADVEVGYLPRDSWGRLARQYARYGFWRARTFRAHRELHARQLAALAPLAALGAALGTPWTLWAALPLLGYLAVAAAAGLAAPARPAARLRAPVALATMHLAWGGGFVAGLLTPWRR